MLEETHDRDQIIQRVAASGRGQGRADLLRAGPGQAGSGRRQEVRAYQTMTRWRLVLAERLGELVVTRVVMAATSDLLEGGLLPAGSPRVPDLAGQRPGRPSTSPGRPKTDTLDAVWLCKLTERQLLRPSLVPPPRPIRQLRDLTRYRADLVAVRTAEQQRVEQAAGWTP
jgi:hypothetical protein